MKKTGAFVMSYSKTADLAAILTLLALSVVALGGCETMPERTSFAPPPPAFDITAVQQQVSMQTVESSVAYIEPAAGNSVVSVSNRSSSTACMNFGGNDLDALGYQMGDGRFGVGFSPSVMHEDKDTFGTALVRYSFSLQKDNASNPCE